MDGEITIGTKLDTDKFDRQISQLEKKMKKEEDKKIIIDAKLGSQQQELDEARQKADALADAYQRLKEAQNKVSTGQATPKEFTTFQDLQSTYGSLEKLGTQFDKALTKQDAIEQKVAQTKYRYDEINAKISEYKQKVENIKIEKQVADVEKLKSGFNSVGSSIQGAVKHVARLALGIFGIRSAFMFLRRASSDLASYDQQYATNLEYIRYALTQMIAPVLQWIVNLAAKLLGYINAIMQGWFGINLFSRGSAENFNKMKAGASGVSKAVKEIKKQLAGFDEINMLTDQSDTGTSAGAGGVGMPSFDLSAMQGEVPEWLQWIIDHKDEILSTLAGIGAGLVFLKLGELAKNLGLIKGEMLGIKAIGFGILVKGIIDLIKSLKGYLEEPSWENFGKVIKSIGEIILGVGILIGNVPLIVAGAIITIVGLIIKHWEDIKAFLQNGIDWLKDKSSWVHNMFGDTIGNIYDTFVKHLQLILDWFDMTFKNIKRILDGIIQFVRGVFTGNWQQAWEGIKNIFGGIFNWIGNTAKTVLQMAWNLVKNFATTGANTVAGIFKTIVNAVLRTIESVLNSPIRTINRLISVINGLPGVRLSTLPTFSLPRLKTGGIINMPNKGTMLGSAIGGESGKEGVIPLTDQQAMAELGAEIGRNVVVNLTNITKVGNRQIAREIKQINAEQEFAFNS
ncbi:MAG: hypothetical protein II393_00240 [Cytophagales bacterium]|nr:hypothetical protein [Cytophagales bacterium]